MKTPSDIDLDYIEFPNNNLWQHVTVTKEGSTLKLYNNGSEVGSLPFTGNADNSDPMWVGGDPTAPFYSNCTIDEFIILNKSLTATEILEEFKR